MFGGLWAGGEVAAHSLAVRAQTAQASTPMPQSWGTYLALPRHTDGRAVLVAGGAINDLLSLAYIEAIAHCLAVQLTLPISLY